MIIYIILVILLIFLLLSFLFIIRKKLGSLVGNKIYSDSEEKPGVILYSKTTPLYGKPDFIIEDKGAIYPVEYKSGRTPASEPYLNHVMQLMAYCLLIEENYGTKPLGGYIKYPEKEYKVLFTDEAREGVKKTVAEIMEYKKSGQEPHCDHIAHN